MDVLNRDYVVVL